MLIERLNQRVHILIAGRARKLYRIIPAVFALVLFGTASRICAQQASGNQSPAHPASPVPAAAGKAEVPPTGTSNMDEEERGGQSVLSEREKVMLDRIEQLERRLAELESRLADRSSGDQPQPVSSTAASASTPAVAPQPVGTIAASISTLAAVPPLSATSDLLKDQIMILADGGIS